MTTKEIQDLVGKEYVGRGHNPVITNLSFLTTHEMDIMSLTQAGYMHEFEVKISKADFKKDAEKKHKHNYLEIGLFSAGLKTPNYFHYVCPAGLIKGHEIPKYAGLIYVWEQRQHPSLPIETLMQEIVEAPLLHKNKHDLNEVLLKVSRVYSERTFLGGCKLTVKNKSIKQKRESLLKDLGFEGAALKQALRK